MSNTRPIRRGQLISRFGVGALVDFRGDESLMTAGLDEWPFANEECPREWLVQEERLQTRLNVTQFRLPPEYREPGKEIQHANQYIPFVRFPRWHYCPMRGAMERLPLFGLRVRCPCRPGLDCQSKPHGRRPWLIPSRFIAVCPKGHIEDFPFMEWVHKNGTCDENHRLRLLPGRSSASLSGMKVECSCGRAKYMTGTFNFDARTGGTLHRSGYDCSGGAPWLGTQGKPSQCGEYLRVVQRGASNVYFPVTVSSIYLPLWGEESSRTINKILEDTNVWQYLTSGLDDGKFIQRVRCEAVALLRKPHDIDVKELHNAAQRKLDGEVAQTESTFRSEEAYRRQEYEALRTGRGGDTTDLMVEVRDSADYGQEVSDFLSYVCLVRKLRETRVLVGFSRLFPVEDPVSENLLPISESNDLNWLPATVVHGEGIFFEFDLNRIRKWAEDSRVKGRVLDLTEGYNQKRRQRGLKEANISPKYVLLHTFAHILTLVS